MHEENGESNKNKSQKFQSIDLYSSFYISDILKLKMEEHAGGSRMNPPPATHTHRHTYKPPQGLVSARFQWDWNA